MAKPYWEKLSNIIYCKNHNYSKSLVKHPAKMLYTVKIKLFKNTEKEIHFFFCKNAAKLMLLKLENLFGHFNQIVFLKYCVSCVYNSLKNTRNPQNLQVFVILWLLTKSRGFNCYICFLSCIAITEYLKDTNLKKMEKILF